MWFQNRLARNQAIMGSNESFGSKYDDLSKKKFLYFLYKNCRQFFPKFTFFHTTSIQLQFFNFHTTLASFFHTTSRNSIDGEWPAMLLNLTDGAEFVLRPLLFAYEDREQITKLLIESLRRLATAASLETANEVSVNDLWIQIDSFMTDAVAKNLKVTEQIAAAIQSDYQPIHLLCKSHTVENLDATNLEVLSNVEKTVKQRETFEQINPSLKSFFRGKKTTVEAGINAIVTLVSRDKSGKSCSLADEFDLICEREGCVKRMFLYQQRRFGKLGKAAAAILEAYSILRMLLDECNSTNQLVEACRLYMASELFYTELQCLAYFNHSVTFPFLNMVEKCSQSDLVGILPTLYNELCQGNLLTLQEYVVNMRGVIVQKPDDELSSYILGKMCKAAADGIKLQCGREYGFADAHQMLRATDISSMAESQLQGLPTNNLAAERNLAIFDKRAAKASKSRNKKFTGVSIRNDLCLYKSNQSKVESKSKLIAKLLMNQEKRWNSEQKSKLKARIELKMAKKKEMLQTT